MSGCYSALLVLIISIQMKDITFTFSQKCLRTLSLVVGLGIGTYGAFAQTATSAVESKTTTPMLEYAKTITPEDLKKHLSIIASDAYEGRETGQKGQKMAAEYIKKHFVACGLEAPVKSNPQEPYFQTFDLYNKKWKEGNITIGKEKLELFKDFFVYGDFSKENAKTDIVFVGKGETDADYSTANVKGKLVAILMDASTPKLNAQRMEFAAKKEAAGVVMIYANDEAFTKRLNLIKTFFSMPNMSLNAKEGNNFMMFYTSPTGAAKIFDMKPKKLNKIIENWDSKKKNIDNTITLNTARLTEKVTSENVLGFMNGTDKADEIVVVTSHYDHVGIINGEIHNGADDDGSGTVTVLEIAEAFAKAKAAGQAPRRSILFMTFTGEEKGLLGSEYYSENPVLPLAQTVVDLNIDMVGRVDKKHENNPNYIYIIGSDMLSTDLHKLSESTREKHFADIELDYTYNSVDDPNKFYYRSDHYNFAKHNIPVIFYFNGVHEDYHKPTDDIEKINFEKMSKVGQLIFGTAWELANANEKPKVDKTAPKE
jgi:Zn-dependent M28 family amino/carboxypeptidase